LPTATRPADRVVDPVRIGAMKWDTITAGWEYFCGTTNGNLYCWGNNEHGNLGLGPTGAVEPTRVHAAP
jgi:alpha-tubulin suppressor-like RCC1 family protein